MTYIYLYNIGFPPLMEQDIKREERMATAAATKRTPVRKRKILQTKSSLRSREAICEDLVNEKKIRKTDESRTRVERGTI